MMKMACHRLRARQKNRAPAAAKPPHHPRATRSRGGGGARGGAGGCRLERLVACGGVGRGLRERVRAGGHRHRGNRAEVARAAGEAVTRLRRHASRRADNAFDSYVQYFKKTSRCSSRSAFFFPVGTEPFSPRRSRGRALEVAREAARDTPMDSTELALSPTSVRYTYTPVHPCLVLRPPARLPRGVARVRVFPSVEAGARRGVSHEPSRGRTLAGRARRASSSFSRSRSSRAMPPRRTRCGAWPTRRSTRPARPRRRPRPRLATTAPRSRALAWGLITPPKLTAWTSHGPAKTRPRACRRFRSRRR